MRWIKLKGFLIIEYCISYAIGAKSSISHVVIEISSFMARINNFSVKFKGIFIVSSIVGCSGKAEKVVYVNVLFKSN